MSLSVSRWKRLTAIAPKKDVTEVDVKHARLLAEKITPALTKLFVMHSRMATQSSLTAPQLSILELLQEEGPQRISQIAKLEAIRMPTASNAVHHLESKNLVARVRTESDRRGIAVELTQLGREELQRVKEERVGYMVNMLSSLPEIDGEELTADEVRHFSRLIVQLADTYADKVISANS